MLDEQHQHFSLPNLHMDTGTWPKTALNPTPGRQHFKLRQSCWLALIDLKLNLRGWPRPSWRTVNSMPMRWPLESIKPAVGGVRCRRWGGFFLVGRQREQDFPERMDPYFSNISWGCDPVNLCDESFWLVLLLWCCGNLFAPESWAIGWHSSIQPLNRHGHWPELSRTNIGAVALSLRTKAGRCLKTTTEWKDGKKAGILTQRQMSLLRELPLLPLMMTTSNLVKNLKSRCDCY